MLLVGEIRPLQSASYRGPQAGNHADKGRLNILVRFPMNNNWISDKTFIFPVEVNWPSLVRHSTSMYSAVYRHLSMKWTDPTGTRHEIVDPHDFFPTLMIPRDVWPPTEYAVWEFPRENCGRRSMPSGINIESP